VRTQYDVSKANVIACFDSDFLCDHPSATANAKGWAMGRKSADDKDNPTMNRMYVVESAMTVTGSAADERLPVKPSRVAHVLVAVATGLGASVGEAKLTDGFTVGLLGGVTPKVSAIGFRLRGIVAKPTSNTRIYLASPAFYYPETNDLGGEPWVLAWPTVNAEYKLDNNIRVWARGGVIGAACVDAIFDAVQGEEHGHESHDQDADGHHHEGDHSTEDSDDGMGFKGGTWQSIGGGVSVPTGRRSTFQAEASVVTDGFSVPDEWVGGPPIVLKLAWSYDI